MARKETSIDIKGFESTFLVQKTSRLQPDDPNPKEYYKSIKHLRRSIPFQDRFASSFDSQINPTILPERIESSIEISYIISELDEPMLTEDNNNLIIE